MSLEESTDTETDIDSSGTISKAPAKTQTRKSAPSPAQPNRLTGKQTTSKKIADLAAAAKAIGARAAAAKVAREVVPKAENVSRGTEKLESMLTGTVISPTNVKQEKSGPSSYEKEVVTSQTSLHATGI